MKRVLLLTAVALAFCSCSWDDVDFSGGGIGYNPSEVICITADTGVATRGTPISSVSDMIDLGVFCSYTGLDDWTSSDVPDKMFNRRLVRNSGNGVWEYDGTPEEWGTSSANDRYTFFSYAPFATGVHNSTTNANGNGIVVNGTAASPGVPTLTYTVPTDVVKQPDLMVAVQKENIRPIGQPVPLYMMHALACIGFEIAGNGEEVTGISISGVRMTGTLDMDGSAITWSNLGAPQDNVNFSASLSANPYVVNAGMSTDLIAGDGYLMMIPQVLGATAKLTITFSDGETSVIPLDTHNWRAGKKITYKITLQDNGGTITVTPSDVLLPAEGVDGGSHNLSVVCSKDDGTPHTSMAWTLTSANSWLTLSLSQSGPGAATVSGTGSQTVYTFASDNASITDTRSTTVYLNNAPATVVTDVTQLYTVVGVGDLLPNTYVGAFWRAEQTGERLIRIQNLPSEYAGEWFVEVLDYGSDFEPGDIVFSTESSKDATVWKNANPSVDMNVAANDANYSVGGDATSVEGVVPAAGGEIFFRIGLKTKWDAATGYSADKPARYAVVMLAYTKGGTMMYQKIYLRQGEEADYIMRNNEPEDSYVMSNITRIRSASRRFSPYNLTAPAFKSGANSGGASVANHPQLAKRGGVFVDYPSQAGALFQLASLAYPRRAYHPTNPKGTAINNWVRQTFSDFWDTVGANNEVCPDSWHLPNDGITNESASNGAASTIVGLSEMRESLWAAPKTSNIEDGSSSGWGYLADGFFDRGAISSSTSTVPNMTGSAAKVAYVGLLFFNPNTNASIFFPATGTRLQMDGMILGSNALHKPGESCFYPTATLYSFGNGQASWTLYAKINVLPGMTRDNNAAVSEGRPIRCVKDE